MDILIYTMLGLAIGSAIGWLACLRWHGWRFRRRDLQQNAREKRLDQRSVAVNQAEDNARKAADALRPYSSSN